MAVNVLRRYGKGVFCIFLNFRFHNDVLLTVQIFFVYKWMSYKLFDDAGVQIASSSGKRRILILFYA